MEYGKAVVLNRGKRDCQLWFLGGWDRVGSPISGVNWDDLKILREDDLEVQWEDNQPVDLGGVEVGKVELKLMEGLDGMIMWIVGGILLGLLLLGEVVKWMFSLEQVQRAVIEFVRPDLHVERHRWEIV